MIEEIKAYKPMNIQEKNDKEEMLRALMHENDALTRENTNHHFVVSAWIVNETHTKVLMVYHNIYDSWSWVGGHMDGDTDPRHKLREEIEEETGLTNITFLQDHIYSLEILPVAKHLRKGEIVEEHQHYNLTYLIEASSKEELRIAPDENQGVAWFPFEELTNKVSEKEFMWVYDKMNLKLNEIEKK